MKKQDLGICERCKKRKAVLVFTESALSYAHGFTENLCKQCYDKIKKGNAWYKAGFDAGYKKGYRKALDDNNILYGKDAKRFLDNMKKVEEEEKNGKRQKT